jgi:pyrimidine operon attenuation protein / uracil phosphoribosyltransferase
MIKEKTLVLDASQVSQKIKRIAYEMYENNFSEKSIVLAGIDGQGYLFAQLLEKELKKISPLKLVLLKIKLDKSTKTQTEISIGGDLKEAKKKAVIVIDDVLNSGRTLAYAFKPFLEIEIKKMEVAVLVNRSNTLFPVSPTYTGYELATTLSDHVEVKLGKDAAVYLV